MGLSWSEVDYVGLFMEMLEDKHHSALDTLKLFTDNDTAVALLRRMAISANQRS